MKIFLYEFVTAGGMCERASVPESLLAEGRAMADALSFDLAAADIHVNRMLDTTLATTGQVTHRNISYHPIASAKAEREIFLQLASSADWTILIAPESEGALGERVAWTQRAGGQLWGPNAEVIELTSDKHRLAVHLADAGIEVPHGIALSAGDSLPVDFPYPAVLKPRDGAGSQGMRQIDVHDPAATAPCEVRLEQFRAGQAASVVILGGPAGLCPLPPCTQTLSADGQFTYLGGSLPLENPLASRATRIACRAVATCGEMRGYVGVDLILGSRADEDCVIEINPRLTSSYLLLRRIAEENLARSILAWREGTGTPPAFANRHAEFSFPLHREVTI